MKQNKTPLWLAVLFAVGLSGCESTPQQNAYYSNQLDMQQAILAAKLAQTDKPLCRIECPPSGCNIGAFECNSESDIEVPRAIAPSNPGDAWAKAAVEIAKVAAPVYLGVKGFDAISDTAKSVSGISSMSTSTNTTTGDTITSGDYRGDETITQTTDTVTTTTTSGDDIGGNYGDGQFGDTSSMIDDHSAPDSVDL